MARRFSQSILIAIVSKRKFPDLGELKRPERKFFQKIHDLRFSLLVHQISWSLEDRINRRNRTESVPAKKRGGSFVSEATTIHDLCRVLERFDNLPVDSTISPAFLAALSISLFAGWTSVPRATRGLFASSFCRSFSLSFC